MLESGHANCFASNTYDTLQMPLVPPMMANRCKVVR